MQFQLSTYDHMKTKSNLPVDYQPLRYRHVLKCALPLSLVFLTALQTAQAANNEKQENIVVQNQQKDRQQQVSGTVTDTDGEKLAGVSIRVKGSTHGTSTDANGHYSLSVAPGSILQFSYIGYERKEIQVTGKQVDVVLKAADNSLEEAVVIGYGTVRKADLAGSVSVMDTKTFKDQPITRVSDALQGRVSGVQVIGSAIPGGSVKVRVRGTGSIHNTNEPLYVVDGVVRETGLEGIDPEDIQSMQILKDASSTAIYGSRGSNGVVLIQTKSGKAGQTQVIFDGSVGFSNATHVPKVLGTKEYAELLNKYKFNNSTPESLKPFLDGSNPGIDWMDMLLRTGTTQDYKVSVSKGNTDTQYYVSANYMKHEGIVVGTEHERYGAKFNLHSKIYPWLELTTDILAARNEGKGEGHFNMSVTNPIMLGLNFSPAMNMYREDGITFSQDPYNSVSADNPYALLTAIDSRHMSHTFDGRFDLKFNIGYGFTFTTTNGADYRDAKSYSFRPKRMGLGMSSMSNSDRFHLMLQSTNNLTYNNKWGDHGLTVTAVYEATKSESRNMGISGTNVIAESVRYWDVTNAVIRGSSNGYSAYTLLSGVGRVIYNYADRYMFTGTFRADGSSRFTNKKWGYFPSVAAAWTATNESFMRPVRDVLNNLKVRGSYGIIGNQNISPYSTLGLLTSTAFNFGGKNEYTGYQSNALATPDLTWERTHQLDLGLDFGFFNNRIELGIDFFFKHTYDALLRRTQANYLGNQGYWVNAGEITNRGIDVSLTGRIFESNDLAWTSSLNLSYNKNKVVKLTAEEPILYGAPPAAGAVDPVSIVKEGEAIGTFYGYVWSGIDDQGRDTYVDFNKDGKIDGADRRVIGCANPDVTFGWNNTIRYKQWEFNAFFNAAFGAQRLNLVRFMMNAMPGSSMFVTDKDYAKNMFVKGGNNVGKTMPALDATGNLNYGNSSKWIEDADYFRAENISIAYNFTKTQTKFADLRLAFSVQNLFTITGYKGSDPAGFTFGNAEYENGVDMGGYPCPRTFTLGARITF